MRTSVDVHNALVEREVPHELVPIPGRARRADRIAVLLGLPPSQVGRVVLFEGGGRVVAAVVPSDREPDPRKVGKAARMAKPSALAAPRATDLTGFLFEALPPVGLPPKVRVLVDPALMDQEVLYFAGGEASSVLKIRSADLSRAGPVRVAPVAA